MVRGWLISFGGGGGVLSRFGRAQSVLYESCTAIGCRWCQCWLVHGRSNNLLMIYGRISGLLEYNIV